MVVGLRKNILKSTLFLIILLCLSSIVSAVYFEVEIAPESQIIKMEETARFKLTVYHDNDFSQSFDVYSPDVEWDISTEPSTDIYLQVGSKEVKTTTLLVRPLYVNPGYYSVGLNIRRSGTNDVIKKSLLLGVSKNIQTEYSPAVHAKIIVPKDVDPRQDVPIKITLKNQNRKKLENIELKIRSEFIVKDHKTSLQPLEEKEIEFKVKLDPKTVPGKDTIQASLFVPSVGGKIAQFDVPAVEYRVIAYGEIESTDEFKTGFLSKSKIIILKNTGNARREKTFTETTNILKRFFTFTDPNARTKKTAEGRVLSWTIKLDADEEEQIVVKTDYKLIFYFLIILIIIGAVYYTTRTPMLIKKAAMIIETVEGGISELKVIVSIKNRTRYPLRDLVVLDKIPNIAKMKEEEQIGTLRPAMIKEHEHGGTLLKWVISDLDPSEERILSYKIRTKLGVLGGFRLPPALIKYKFFNYQRSQVSKVENLFKSL